MQSFTLAQISDTHILPERSGTIHGRDLFARLGAVVQRIDARIQAGGKVDLVVFTGDQVHDAPEAYPTFLAALAPLSVPVAFVPGNHDHREGFAHHLSPLQGCVPHSGRPGSAIDFAAAPPPEGSLCRTIRSEGVRLLLLDSLWDGNVAGRLGPDQLRWIAETLGREPGEVREGTTLAFVHHPPIPTGVDWLDPHVIEDGDELVRILASGGVSHVFFGHVHQPMTLGFRGLIATSAPATSFGFGGDGDAPVILEGPPALTWIDVQGSHVRTRVESVPV